MGFFDSIGGQIASSLDSLREKNHRAAVISRLHIVIKNERENSARAYVALGKYFYEHLRGQGNAETDALCACIDDSDRHMKRAFEQMDEIRESSYADVDESECADCNDDCSACKFHEGDEISDTDLEYVKSSEEDMEQPQDKKNPDAASAPAATPEKSAEPEQPAPAVTPADEEAAPEEPEA